MALDFPASPIVGQKYPQPSLPGVPVYSWDGEKWIGGLLPVIATTNIDGTFVTERIAGR